MIYLQLLLVTEGKLWNDKLKSNLPILGIKL